MSGRNLTLALGAIALGVVALALAACSEAGPQRSAAATPTDRLAAEVTPAGCGTVTAQQTSDTSTPSPGTEWTFPAGAYVRVAAKANAGCAFVRFDLVLNDSVVFSSTGNPFQFQLFTGLTTVRAHFSGTPSTTPTPTATATATATSTPSANACTQTTLGVDPATNSCARGGLRRAAGGEGGAGGCRHARLERRHRDDGLGRRDAGRDAATCHRPLADAARGRGLHPERTRGA